MKNNKITGVVFITLTIALCLILYKSLNIEKENINISFENNTDKVKVYSNKEAYNDLIIYLDSIEEIKVNNIMSQDNIHTLISLSYEGNIEKLYETFDNLKRYENVESIDNMSLSKNKEKSICSFNINIKSN